MFIKQRIIRKCVGLNYSSEWVPSLVKTRKTDFIQNGANAETISNFNKKNRNSLASIKVEKITSLGIPNILMLEIKLRIKSYFIFYSVSINKYSKNIHVRTNVKRSSKNKNYM